MDALVTVGLRRRDIILETSRNRVPQRVDDAQGRITVRYGIRDNPDREQIVDIVKIPSLGRHLPVDTVKMLGSSVNLRFDSLRRKLLFDDGRDPFDEFLAPFFLKLDLLDQIVICVRFQVFQ